MSHHCVYPLPSSLYGPAIDDCCERDRKLYAGNGEYESQVNYCPFCGYEAKEKVPIKLKEEYDKSNANKKLGFSKSRRNRDTNFSST